MSYQFKQSKRLSSRVWRRNVLLMLILMLGSQTLCGQSVPSPLHVDGPFLVNAEGRRVNLHGFAQTFSPWFNEQRTKWDYYDVNRCLSYNKGIIDGIMNAGWKMTFVRQHMDPYWSNTPGKQTKVIIDLHQMKAYKDDACTQFDHRVDPSHIYIAGFWTTGGSPIYIKNVFLSDDGINPTGISEYETSHYGEVVREYYTPDGRKLDKPQPGLNIVKVTETDGKTRIFKVCYKI